MALSMTVALSLPAGSLAGQSAGASTPPVTAVLFPWNGAAIHGTQVLDAVAWAGFRDKITSVEFVLTGGSYKRSIIGTATPSIFGWVFIWNTSDVPNGTYALRSMATDATGNISHSPKITISVSNPLEVALLISQFPTVTVGENPYPPVAGQYSWCAGSVHAPDFAAVTGGVAPYSVTFSTSPQIYFSGGDIAPEVWNENGLLSFLAADGTYVYVTGTPGGETVEDSEITFTVTDATGASTSISLPWTIDNPDRISCYTGLG